jgi:pimeloyl-ACP methyl ester carboxylesterase
MRTETVDLGYLEMCYEREGNGEPLLLLHGGTGCHGDRIYAGRDEFVREYSVMAPDARGHGATSNPDVTITHRQMCN